MVDINKGHIVLGYWGIRGRGQPLRHLLAYSGLDWEDKVYEKPQQWYGNGDKTKLNLEFPNLPYLINKNFVLTESIAIAKYICNISKKQLLGKNQEDNAKIEMLLSLFQEIFAPTFGLFFSPAHKTEAERIFNGKVKDKLEQLKKFVADRNTVLPYLTIVDFKFAEASEYIKKLYGEANYKQFQFLERIRDHVENLKQVKKYYEKNPKARQWKYLNDYAQLKF